MAMAMVMAMVIVMADVRHSKLKAQGHYAECLYCSYDTHLCFDPARAWALVALVGSRAL